VILLAAVTVLLFARACGYGFIDYDDGIYVLTNPHTRGLTPPNIRWALTTTYFDHWHPLTWWSWQLDYSLHTLDPRGYHLTNTLLHAAATALFFLVFWRATSRPVCAALVAALFAWHPLHVESVVWIAERKDVLSGLFCALTLYSYIRYATNPSPAHYALVLGAYALGLMSKAMLVTLPAVLLLLDYWPLGRWRPGAARWLLLEKLPLALLALADALVIALVQRATDPGPQPARLPLRIENALVACIAYLRKLVWPVDLAAFYPFPRSYSLLLVAGCVALLVAMSLVAYRARRDQPWLLIGWLWYLGMLVPVLGLFEVHGGHALADRYTYLPIMGVLIAVVWTAAAAARRWQATRLGLAVAFALLAGCLAASSVQVSWWRNGLNLWKHALAVTSDNYGAHWCMGAALAREGRLADAADQFRRAVTIYPDFSQAHFSLGLALAQQGDVDGAIASYRQALARQPRYPDAHTNLGNALLARGEVAEAAQHYRAAIDQDPAAANAHYNLALLLMRQADVAGALREFEAVVRLRPDDAAAQDNLGTAYCLQGHAASARACFAIAVHLQPVVAQYRYDLAHALHELGQVEEARDLYHKALQLDPGWPESAADAARQLASLSGPARNPRLATRLALQACEASGYARADCLDALAASYAAAGDVERGTATARQALALLASDTSQHAADLRARLRGYAAQLKASPGS
jgi:tetratricopeptide (TPR) repeat protein